MTFAETDYSGLVSEIERVLEGKNPFEAIELIKEMLRIHKKVSLYPGLVALVAKSVREEVNVSDLAPGDQVTWTVDGKSFEGTVSKKDEEGVVFDVLHESMTRNDATLMEGKVTRIRHDALPRTWPSLVFPEKVKMTRSSADAGKAKGAAGRGVAAKGRRS